MRVKPSNSHWVFEQSAQRCILAFSKDTYCQFNRYWIFVELTVTVYNFKASVLPRSCCCPLAIRYTFPSKCYICYILWSVGQALFQICFHSLLVHCIIYLAAGDMTVKQLLLKTFKKKEEFIKLRNEWNSTRHLGEPLRLDSPSWALLCLGGVRSDCLVIVQQKTQYINPCGDGLCLDMKCDCVFSCASACVSLQQHSQYCQWFKTEYLVANRDNNVALRTSEDCFETSSTVVSKKLVHSLSSWSITLAHLFDQILDK